MPNVKRESYRTKDGEIRERWRVRVQRKVLRLDRCFPTKKEAEDCARAASTPQGAAFLRQEQEALSREQLAAQEAKRLILLRTKEKTISEVLALYLRKRYGYDPLKDEKPLAEMTDDERRKRSARVSDQARISAFAETYLPIERDEAGRIARVGDAEGLAAFLPDRAKEERIGSLRASDLESAEGDAVVLAYIRSRKECVGERSKKPISLGSIRREINVFRAVWNNLPFWVSGASSPKSNPFAGKSIGKSLEGANAERDRRLLPAEIAKIREGLDAYQREINVKAFENAAQAEKAPLAVPVVIEEDDGGGSVVECPDLGLSLAAESEDEALALMRRAIEKRIRKGGFSVSSVKDISRRNPGKIILTIQLQAA